MKRFVTVAEFSRRVTVIGLPLIVLCAPAEADIQFTLPLPAPSASPIAHPLSIVTPSPIKIATVRPAVYVLAAVGSDLTMATALSLETAMRIAPQLGTFGPVGPKAPGPMIIPEPTWTLDDLAEQCRVQAATTRGAIVVGPLENDSGTWNAFVYLNGYMRLSGAASLIECRDERLTLAWQSTNFVHGRWQQGGIPFLPIALLGTYFIGHAGAVTAPWSETTTHAPDTTTSKDAGAGASTTTTATTPASGAQGPVTVSTTGSSSSNTSASQTQEGTTVATSSQQVTTSNTALAGSLGSLFAVASTFGDRAFPVSPQSAQSTYLKHATGRLADDLFNQLKSECSGTSACAAMFAPVASVSTATQQ